MATARSEAVVVVSSNGTGIVAGGRDAAGAIAGSEIYLPDSRSFSPT